MMIPLLLGALAAVPTLHAQQTTPQRADPQRLKAAAAALTKEAMALGKQTAKDTGAKLRSLQKKADEVSRLVGLEVGKQASNLGAALAAQKCGTGYEYTCGWDDLSRTESGRHIQKLFITAYDAAEGPGAGRRRWETEHINRQLHLKFDHPELKRRREARAASPQ